MTVAKILYLGAALDHWISYSGTVSEFLVFQGALSAADTAKVQNYLQGKYGIAN